MTLTANQTLSAADPALWYVPDERLTRADAARDASRIARWTQLRTDAAEPDEQALFVALHTCAFNAEKGAEKKRAEWRERWRAIREYIVEKNLGLVHMCVRRLQSRVMDEDDLLSEAMSGLGRAVDRFNPWRGFRFSTYACNVIARALMRRGKQESRYRRLVPVQHDDSFEKATDLPDSRKELCLDRLRVALNRNLGQLSELEATVLRHRFREDCGSELTYQEIGKIIGLSKERVRQIQNRALDKLRTVLLGDPTLV